MRLAESLLVVEATWLTRLSCVSFWFAALAEDYNVRDTACDDTFHMFKYCGFNGAGFLLSLLTYFILKTGEAARARGALCLSQSMPLSLTAPLPLSLTVLLTRCLS